MRWGGVRGQAWEGQESELGCGQDLGSELDVGRVRGQNRDVGRVRGQQLFILLPPRAPEASEQPSYVSALGTSSTNTQGLRPVSRLRMRTPGCGRLPASLESLEICGYPLCTVSPQQTGWKILTLHRLPTLQDQHFPMGVWTCVCVHVYMLAHMFLHVCTCAYVGSRGRGHLVAGKGTRRPWLKCPGVEEGVWGPRAGPGVPLGSKGGPSSVGGLWVKVTAAPYQPLPCTGHWPL